MQLRQSRISGSIVMAWIVRFGLLLLFLSWCPISGAPSYVYSPICRDPDLGGRPLLSRVITNNDTSTVAPAEVRKYLLVGGAGAGIGNFLVFFPAAYYFGVFTGRDLLVIDDSLIGELCSVLQCGFPKYNGVAAAYPGLLTPAAYRAMGHAKVRKSQSKSANPILITISPANHRRHKNHLYGFHAPPDVRFSSIHCWSSPIRAINRAGDYYPVITTHPSQISTHSSNFHTLQSNFHSN